MTRQIHITLLASTKHVKTFSTQRVENLKYLTYMPTQEELRREIEQQKEFFKLHNEK